LGNSVKVIFNSGCNSETIRMLQMLQEAGYHYLQKPYAPQQHLQKIQEVLAEGQALGVIDERR